MFPSCYLLTARDGPARWASRKTGGGQPGESVRRGSPGLATWRRGAPDDELRSQVEHLDRAILTSDPLQQQLRRLGSQLVVGETDGGEGRPQPVDEGHVVEAD